MIDQPKRAGFVNYLDSLLAGNWNDSQWFNYIIEHYIDERLEEIRRGIVRLRIAEGDPKVFPTTEESKKQIRIWAEELR